MEPSLLKNEQARIPNHENWSETFVDYLKPRFHGHNLQALILPKPEVAEMAEHFGGNHMPDDALEVAKIAHIAELGWQFNLSSNITRALDAAFDDSLDKVTPPEWDSHPDAMPLKYTLGLIRDFPEIADFIKTHEAKCARAGVEFVDILGLVDLVERVNFESIIIKSALDYSNFLLLNGKDHLSEKEKTKMRRIITTIKTVDSPLLGLTGFDALEAEILSKAYLWELEQDGHDHSAKAAEGVFDRLGGRQELTVASETFIKDLFANDSFSYERVTSEQENYNLHFADGKVALNGSSEDLRVLSRLKSVGSTAKKIHTLYEKTGACETPMDIIGVTLIAKDKDELEVCLAGVLERLHRLDTRFQSAPSRFEEVHVKGRPDFLEKFGQKGASSHLYETHGLRVKDEQTKAGHEYEAVKLTLLYQWNGKEIPVEIQITHEAARKGSRVGMSSHTIFKIMKLAEESADVTIGLLSTEDLLEALQRISVRKDKFNSSSYETNGQSTQRAKAFFEQRRKHRLMHLLKKTGHVAIRDKIHYN